MGGDCLGRCRRKYHSRRNREKKRYVWLAAALVTAGCCIFALTGIFQEHGEKETATILAASKPAAVGKAADASVSEENRQVVLSMGQNRGTMYVSWKGDADGPAYFRYSQDKYSLPVVQKLTAHKAKILHGGSYRYTIRLDGLEEGRLYYYEIGDGVVYDSPRFFYAPEEDGEDVFAYLGDPQFDKLLSDYKAWGSLVWNMYKENQDVEFVIGGGDMINLPTREDHWNGFLDQCGLFSMIPFMTVPGNHEGVSSNLTYKKLFHRINNGPQGEAFYYFDYGNCRFIMLDSSFLTKARQLRMGKAAWRQKEQAVERWMRRTLADSDRTWNIVVTHHPVYGMHDIATVSPEIREKWLPIMEEEGADLVLCGHQHVYMRTRKIDGIVHVMGVSGAKQSKYYRGFNAPAYSESLYAAGPNYQIIRATAAELELISYSKKGSIIDAARIEKSLPDRLTEKLGIPFDGS